MAETSTPGRSGAHALLAALEARGIRHLFGVPGHGAYPIYDALNDVPAIRPVIGRHEQGITFAAVGYAWATNRVAVATSVPAAGLTNASTSLLEATWSQDRLLFLLEEDPLHRDVLRAVARYYARVDGADEIGDAVHGLLDQLETGRPGAAALEIPNRALRAEVRALPGPHRPLAATAVPAQPLLDEAAALLTGAPRCAILAGASALAADPGESVRRLAEALGAPIFTDAFAKGLVSEEHPLVVGRGWTLHGPGEALLRECERVLVVGAPVALSQGGWPWNPAMVRGGRADAQLAEQLILVDWDDRELGALPARMRLYGDVGRTLEALAELVRPRQERPFLPERLAAMRQVAWEYAERRNGWALEAIRGLGRALPKDAILLGDSLIALWLDWLLPMAGPRRMRFPNGTGTLGWGIPAAIGAKLAHPQREVVVVAGDGAFLYNPQELATMQLYGLKLTVVIADDGQYSAIRHNMAENFGRSSHYRIANPDFVRFGESFGMRARRLDSPDQLGAAVAEALAGERSTLIDCPLEVLPMRELYDLAPRPAASATR